jgi:formylmethanofuran dehydrogenase subunit E-like metal-binding protein
MFQGGLAHTAYSMVVWDVADQKYSNNKTLPQGATLVEGADAGANMYIVKPEQAMTYWGSENGRYSMESNANIVSSSKYQTQGFWIYSICASWVADLSRYVIIELDPSYRNGLN